MQKCIQFVQTKFLKSSEHLQLYVYVMYYVDLIIKKAYTNSTSVNE